jgi:hypothetical protein
MEKLNRQTGVSDSKWVNAAKAVEVILIANNAK